MISICRVYRLIAVVVLLITLISFTYSNAGTFVMLIFLVGQIVLPIVIILLAIIVWCIAYSLLNYKKLPRSMIFVTFITILYMLMLIVSGWLAWGDEDIAKILSLIYTLISTTYAVVILMILKNVCKPKIKDMDLFI